jgi:1-acyl-sn-glycerol-3-phosphate acyltransferase
MHWIYYGGRVFTRAALTLFTRFQIRGRENIPKRGPLMVVANHLALADPPILGVSISRKAMFMAKEELFRSAVPGYVIRSYGAFPVRRSGLNRDALRRAQDLFERDMALVIFPEGRRSLGRQLESAFSGAAMLAMRYQVPVLPVGIHGTEHIGGATWWLRRPRIRVNIGSPFMLPAASGKVTRAELVEHTHRIMAHIAGLLPKEYRGSYGGRKTGTAKHTPGG